MYEIYENYNCLAHHGVKGMKWGVRRLQNKDGSLTVKGRNKHGVTGKVTIDDKGKMVDSATGKRVSRKMRGMVENRMLNDSKISSKTESINKKYNDAKAQRDLKRAEYDQASRKYNADMTKALNNGNTASGINSGLSARSSRIIMEHAKQSYKEAEAQYKQTQKEVDAFVMDYMNANIDKFRKN